MRAGKEGENARPAFFLMSVKGKLAMRHGKGCVTTRPLIFLMQGGE